ncbi:hypothetical protein [Halorussus salinisoli]|uniref:hypothetical protein n=1 Tax=Halorussus salinisoli TaxID=2558242 RepID=UPI0010C1B2AF|nr:hypothetical protein [Halorussus salinisoli]
MSGSSRLGSYVADRRLDVLGAVAGLLVAVVLFPMRFLASQIYVETIPIVVGSACLLYLLTVREDVRETDLPELSGGFARFAPGVVVAGIGVMAALAAVSGRRTVGFLALAAVVAAGILIQIAFVAEEQLDVRVLLVQILGLAFVVRFTALYLTPGLVGIDSWSHLYEFADAILADHSLAAIGDTKYFTAPLYHLLVVTAAEVLGVSLRRGLFLSLGVLMALSVLFVYVTARFFVPVRWALFGTAMFAVSDQAVRWSIHVIPTSLGLFFFGAIVYALARLFYTESPRRNVALVVVFSVAIVLTHQVSSFIMLVLVGAGVFAQLLVRFSGRWSLGPLAPPGGGEGANEVGNSDAAGAGVGASQVNLLGVLAFDLGLLVIMWSITPYGDDSFLRTVLDWLVLTLADSAGFLNLAGSAGASTGDAGAEPSLLADIATYLDAGGILLLLFVTVLGSLVALGRSQARQRAYTFVGAIAIMLAFAFVLPLFGIRTFLPSRWFAFLHVLMVVVGAIGLYHLSRTLPREVAVALVVMFAATFSAVMVFSVSGTRDNPVVSSERTRYAYTESELAAVRTIGDVRPNSAERLYTDHPYKAVFRRTEAHPSATLELTAGGRPIAGTDVRVYRRYQSDGGARFEGPDGFAPIRHLSEREVCGARASNVYSNGDVRMCLAE